MSARAAAEDYVRRGWAPLPVPYMSKAPIPKQWQNLHLGLEDLAQHFNGQPANVGVLLGVASGGLTDVDLDCAEAVRLAPVFLPPTQSRFGRKRRGITHYLYVVVDGAQSEEFVDPDAPADKAMLIEIRIDRKSTRLNSSH